MFIVLCYKRSYVHWVVQKIGFVCSIRGLYLIERRAYCVSRRVDALRGLILIDCRTYPNPQNAYLVFSGGREKRPPHN